MLAHTIESLRSLRITVRTVPGSAEIAERDWRLEPLCGIWTLKLRYNSAQQSEGRFMRWIRYVTWGD